MEPRAVSIAGALLALLASAHRHALTAEVAFLLLVSSQELAQRLHLQRGQCSSCSISWSCVLQLVLAAVLHSESSMQVEQPRRSSRRALMPPRRPTLPYAVFGPRTALLALFGCVVRVSLSCPTWKGLLSHTGHSAAIYTARGDLYDVPVAERLPRRLHGVPSPVGAATGTGCHSVPTARDSL